MDNFLNWFYVYITQMFGGVWNTLKAFYNGVVGVFNFPLISQNLKGAGLTAWGWVLAILSLVVVYAFWAFIVFLIVLAIRKRIKLNKLNANSEEMLDELSDLHHDVMRLTREKEKILALKVGQSAITREQLEEIFQASTEGDVTGVPMVGGTASTATATAEGESGNRFIRLTAVDEKYRFYTAPNYSDDMDLPAIAEDFRNFCCTQMHLFYDLRTVHLLLAGLASTKLLLLQGISGTGKTSFPYALGKYLVNDATIVAVQPSWRERTELFGFYNEFTHQFNETEVLRRIYDANYNDNINVIVLDEMNIARVEYYFAEMLSLMEMPNPNEWLLEIVPSGLPGDPTLLKDGKLFVPGNVWYIGTANNDDSTFAVSDKVYDRAFTINLDAKGIPFDAPYTEAKQISYTHLNSLFQKAWAEHKVSQETLTKINQLDLYIIQHFRVAFGNRIIKQLHFFVPVLVACGETEVAGIDYLLATKVYRKFDSLNLSLIRDEIKGLMNYMDLLFGKGNMPECTAYLKRLQKQF